MTFLAELKRRNVVRVALFYIASSWFVLQVADLLFEAMELPGTWLRLVLALLILGFPVALIFSWVYEMTPDGLKRESEVDREASVTADTGRRLNVATIATVLLASVLLLADRFVFDRGAEAPATSAADVAAIDSDAAAPIVAVLPFATAGSDDGGFLAVGLHDDLLTRIAKVGAFRVISRTSMMEYANTTKNIRQIGDELGARYILEGGVQARADRVRVNAQLIDADLDEHLWAETYDRELTATDLFDIQAELAHAIADALELTLSAPEEALIESVPTLNLEAYNAYLRGLDLRNEGGHTLVYVPQVIDAFRQAVTLDPEFALAWVQLSTEYSRYSQITLDDATGAAALDAIEKARSIDPGLPEIELAIAAYQYRVLYEYDRALEALEAFETEAALTGPALLLKAWIQRRTGRYDEAYASALKAQVLDPRSMGVANILVNIAWETGRCDDAERHARAALALAPDSPNVRGTVAEFELSCNGDAARASALMSDIEFTDGFHTFTAMRAAEAARDYERIIELAREEFPTRFPFANLFWRAEGLRGLGREEELNAVLDELGPKLEALEQTDIDEELPAFARILYSSLRGDAEATQYWIDEHRRLFAEAFKGNLPFEMTNLLVYAECLATVGLEDEAMAELSLMLEAPGSFGFPFVELLPSFDGVRDHPDYIDLRERYLIR